MHNIAVWALVAVVCVTTKGTFATSQAETDSAKLNGKRIIFGTSKGPTIKSAIPYADGHIEVTIWTKRSGKFSSILALLKKAQGAGYEYEKDGFHAVEDGEAVSQTILLGSYGSIKTNLLLNINGVIDGNIQVEADPNNDELTGEADLKKVGGTLRTTKQYVVDGKTWDIVGVQLCPCQAVHGGKLMFVAKRKDGENHYSKLVVAILEAKPAQGPAKINVLELFSALNGKIVSSTAGEPTQIGTALTALNI